LVNGAGRGGCDDPGIIRRPRANFLKDNGYFPEIFPLFLLGRLLGVAVDGNAALARGGGRPADAIADFH
jgi:hypothetical protein